MKRYFFPSITICLLFLIIPFYVKSQNAPSSYLEALKLLKDMEGKPAPNFEATTLQGKKVNLDMLKGKTIVINFWFVGCLPCEEEMPLLNKLTDEYKNNENIVFLGLSTSDKTKTEIFLRKNSFNYQIVADAKSIAQKFNISGYPSHFIIDPEGIVRYVSIASQDDIDLVLSQAIKSISNNSKTQPITVKPNKLSIGKNTVFKNEKGEILANQEAIQMLTAQQHQALKEYDKDGKEYILVKKKP